MIFNSPDPVATPRIQSRLHVMQSGKCCEACVGDKRCMGWTYVRNGPSPATGVLALFGALGVFHPLVCGFLPQLLTLLVAHSRMPVTMTHYYKKYRSKTFL